MRCRGSFSADDVTPIVADEVWVHVPEPARAEVCKCTGFAFVGVPIIGIVGVICCLDSLLDVIVLIMCF